MAKYRTAQAHTHRVPVFVRLVIDIAAVALLLCVLAIVFAHCWLLVGRLCIPTEFRRILAELGKKAPAGTECDRNAHRNVL